MNGWRIAFIVAHIVEGVVIWALFKDYHFVDPAIYNEAVKSGNADAIQVAYQIGRLDLASMFLAGISVLLGLAAIFAFVEVRSRAIRNAAETAKLEATRVAQEVAELQISPEASRIIEEFFDRKGIDINALPRKSDKMASDAAEIAAALEDGKQ
jgi:hypothetical protein